MQYFFGKLVKPKLSFIEKYNRVKRVLIFYIACHNVHWKPQLRRKTEDILSFLCPYTIVFECHIIRNRLRLVSMVAVSITICMYLEIIFSSTFYLNFSRSLGKNDRISGDGFLWVRNFFIILIWGGINTLFY